MRTTGIEIDRTASRRENVDLLLEFHLRGPRRLQEQALIAVVHHPLVGSVSTGE